MKSKLIYYLTYAGMWLLASLPFWALYGLSDAMCFILHYVVRYRRRVVRGNLRRSFPEKDERELRHIEQRFYHYICDYLVEEVKTMRISFEELCRRMTYGNADLYLEMIDRYGGIIVLMPHYANFEWCIGMGAIMRKGDLPVQIYKPLHNPYMDELFKHIRSRFGGVNIPKHSTARELIRLRRAGKHMAVGLITDQSPKRSEAHHWTTFLNQETVFMNGGERLARMMGFPVFYSELTRTGRGHCRVDFELITEHPKDMAEGEITEQFVRRLEQTIRRDPPYWFWSHRRWKRRREETKAHEPETAPPQQHVGVAATEGAPAGHSATGQQPSEGKEQKQD